MNRNPNIVLYFVDDLGYGDISCFNENSKIHTENIDAMARDGMMFTDAHASSSVCTPSRYGLLTGRYNWRSRLKRGIISGEAAPLIEEGRLTLGSLLQKQGYRTAVVGKWHLGLDWICTDGKKLFENPTSTKRSEADIDFTAKIQNGPNTRGFDYFYGMTASLNQAPYVTIENDRPEQIPDHYIGTTEHDPYRPGGVGIDNVVYGLCAPDFDMQKIVPMMHEKVLELVDEFAKGDEPFFIYSPTPAVHSPLVPADEFVGKSGIGPYGDFVLQVDHFIGELNAKLEALGIADSTIVIFTSDNGCSTVVDMPRLAELGHHPSYVFRGSKSDIWEGGHRVPFIVKWPEAIKKNQKSDQYICLTDMFATFGEIVGYDYGDSAGEDSVSNLPIWLGEDWQVRENVIHHSRDGCFSIRRGNWKLELCTGSGGRSFPSDGRDDVSDLAPVQLYDLSRDIGEQENLCEKYPEVVKQLRDIVVSYIVSGRSTPGADQKNHSHNSVWPGLNWLNL